MTMILAFGTRACALRGTRSPSKYVADFSNVICVVLLTLGGKKFRYLLGRKEIIVWKIIVIISFILHIT